MSGIVGEIAFNGRKADLATVGRMSEVMARTPYGHGSCSWGWVALGHKRQRVTPAQRPAAQPLADDRLGLGVVLTGYLLNQDALHIELAGHYPFHRASAPEIILAAYHRWGERFVERLQGVFTLAVVDALRQKVLLARDVDGAVPLYLGRGPDVLRFASDPQCLRVVDGLQAPDDLVPVPPGTVQVFEPSGRTGVRTFTPAALDGARA